MFNDEISELKKIISASKKHNNNELFWLEFKTNFPDEEVMFDILGKNVSGIANSCTYHKKEFGYIVCGVEDETLKEVGVDFDPFNLKKGNQDLEIYLRSKLIGVDFEMIPFNKDNKKFLMIRISKSLGQISRFNKISYFRVGKNIKPLNACSQELQLKMHYSIRKSEFWDRAILSDIEISTVLEKLHYDVYYLRQRKSIPTNSNNIIKDFIDEGFLKQTEKGFDITFLGMVLFARNLYEIDETLNKRIRITTFKNNSKIDGYTHDIYGQKGYAAAFEDMVNYIISQIPEDQIVEGINRKHQHKFSITSIREFLANMIIHQDFFDSSNPTIEIYPDRIQFVNIGTCLVEVDRIMDAVPKTRNPKLVDIMRRLRFCEQQGSGIDRAVREIEQMMLPAPNFENKPNGFIATLYALKSFNSYTDKEKMKACYLHICLEYIWQKENNYRLATNQTIRERFNLSLKKQSTVSNLIKICIEHNLIKKFDPDSNSKKYQKYIPYWA
jgi:ATP-dependent DNA helicase RecG